MVRSTWTDSGMAAATLRSTICSLRAPIDRSGRLRARVALAALPLVLGAGQGGGLEDLLAHDGRRLVRTPGRLCCGPGLVHGVLPHAAGDGVVSTVSRPRWHSESTKTAASRAAVAWSTSKVSHTRVMIVASAVRPSADSQISVPTAFSVCSVLSSGETITASPSYTRQAARALCRG